MSAAASAAELKFTGISVAGTNEVFALGSSSFVYNVGYSPDFGYAFGSGIRIVALDGRLKLMQEKIEKELVLPEDLVQAFLVVAENKLAQVRDIKPINSFELSQIYDPENQSTMAVAKQFMREMIYWYNFYRVPSEGLNISQGEYGSRKFQASFYESIAAQSQTNSTVQLLIGDVGATGVSRLAELYGEASGRKIRRIYLGSQREIDTNALARTIQSMTRENANPILIFEEVDRYSFAAKSVLTYLLHHRHLLGNASVIITESNKEPLPERQSFWDLEGTNGWGPNVDALHVVRRPASPAVYEKIIEKVLPESLARMAKMRGMKSAELALPSPIVERLALAVYGLQEKTGVSQVRTLFDALERANKHICDEELNSTSEMQNWLTAVKDYEEAIIFR